MQILLQPRVSRRIACGEVSGAADRRVVILHAAVPAQRCFIAVRHAIAIRIDGRGGGCEGAKAAVGHSERRFTADHVPHLIRDVAHRPRIHLIPHRAGVGRVQTQRPAAGDQLFISQQSRLHRQQRRSRDGRHAFVVTRKIRRGGHIRHHLRRIVFLPLHDVVAAIRAIEHAIAIDVMQVPGNMHGEVRFADAAAVQPAFLQRPGADVARRADEVIAHHVRLPRGGRVRVAHDEADAPVEGHIVRPLQQAIRA